MRLIQFDDIDSTNIYARNLAKNGEYGPLWISAKTQRGGMGRRGRKWVSQAGNLFATGLYPHKGSAKSAALYSFVAALAVYDVITANINQTPKIKWPNDILVEGNKVSGLLLESGGSDGDMWIAIGIGINLVNAPELVDKKTASLADYGFLKDKQAISVLNELIDRFGHWRKIYMEQGFDPIRQKWLERAQGIGEEVKAVIAEKTVCGFLLGIDKAGALAIKTANNEIVKIHAGDVFFCQ